MTHSDVPVDQKKELEQGWTDFYWDPLKVYFEKNRSKRKSEKRRAPAE
jgi:hypothetical protein